MEQRLPLGILRHCLKALDVAMCDLREASVDDDLDEATSARLESYSEIIGNTCAGIINLVSDEMEEDDFIREEIPTIEELEDEPENIMDMQLDD